MELECLVPCSQEPSIGPYIKPDKSTLETHILFL
jgi:hypothetical protein